LTNELPLFRAYPALRARIPRCPFISAPTPVVPLPLPGLDQDALLVKDDALSCPLHGGNKPRKLELIIGRALERGSRRLVTTGALGTHHGLATTILGRSVGLATTLVLVPQPVTPEVEQAFALDVAWGAEVVRAAGVQTAALQVLRVLLRSQALGERPHLVWTGGSTALGNLGFVSAAFELAEQISTGELREPAEILVALGSGGTTAGLVLGLRLAGLSIPVRAVLVTDIMAPSPRSLARGANATLALMRRIDPGVPDRPVAPSDFVIDDSELGPGYGSATDRSAAALDLAARHGLKLDSTYTAKCFAAVLARAERGASRPGPLLFWNTHNGVEIGTPPAAPSRTPPGARSEDAQACPDSGARTLEPRSPLRPVGSIGGAAQHDVESVMACDAVEGIAAR
jgi:D-cysteine desulfhydrase